MNLKARLRRIESKWGAKNVQIVIASHPEESESEARARLNLPRATKIILFYNVLPR